MSIEQTLDSLPASATHVLAATGTNGEADEAAFVPIEDVRGAVSITEHGARPDGTDIADAWDSAVAYCRANARSLYVPSGTWSTSRELAFNVSDSGIYGAGKWASQIVPLAGFTGGAVVRVGDAEDAQLGDHGITVQDLTFGSKTVDGLPGLRVDVRYSFNANRLKIIGGNWDGVNDHGALWITTARNAVFNEIESASQFCYGVYARRSDGSNVFNGLVSFINCIFTENVSGLILDTGYASMLTIANCHIANNDKDRAMTFKNYGIYARSNNYAYIFMSRINQGDYGVVYDPTSGSTGNAFIIGDCIIQDADRFGVVQTGTAAAPITIKNTLFDSNGKDHAPSDADDPYNGNNLDDFTLSTYLCDIWLNSAFTKAVEVYDNTFRNALETKVNTIMAGTGGSSFSGNSQAYIANNAIVGDTKGVLTGVDKYIIGSRDLYYRVLNNIRQFRQVTESTIDASAGSGSQELLAATEDQFEYRLVVEITSEFNGDTITTFSGGRTGATAERIAATGAGAGTAGNVTHSAWLRGDGNDLLITWTNTASATAGELLVHVEVRT